MAMAISLKDFYFLNPMINNTCGNLWLDTYYCVEAVGNIATYSNYNQYVSIPTLSFSVFHSTPPHISCRPGGTISYLYSHIFHYSASMSVKGGPCHQLNAPASCFVTTYRTTHPFTWPAVGQAGTKTTAPFPKATLMKDLPLAPGTRDCGSFTQYYNSSRSNGNQCGMVAWVFTRK